jgi:hypothetical protein
LIASDAENGAGDFITNHDGLANSPREDKHVCSPLMTWFRDERHVTPSHKLPIPRILG